MTIFKSTVFAANIHEFSGLLNVRACVPIVLADSLKVDLKGNNGSTDQTWLSRLPIRNPKVKIPIILTL